jgi:hypothetical protein
MFKQFSGFSKMLLILGAIGLFSIVFSAITGRSACLIYSFIGVPCPSCGMTRAFLSLFRGDLSAALSNHPLFIIILLTPGIFLLKGLSEKKRSFLFCIIAAVFLVVWLLRLYLYFPHTDPFTLNQKAVIPMIIDFLKHV